MHMYKCPTTIIIVVSKYYSTEGIASYEDIGPKEHSKKPQLEKDRLDGISWRRSKPTQSCNATE